MRKGLACVPGLATGDKRSQSYRSFTSVAGFWEAGTLGTNQSQSPTIGASREDLS